MVILALVNVFGFGRERFVQLYYILPVVHPWVIWIYHYIMRYKINNIVNNSIVLVLGVRSVRRVNYEKRERKKISPTPTTGAIGPIRSATNGAVAVGR